MHVAGVRHACGGALPSPLSGARRSQRPSRGPRSPGRRSAPVPGFARPGCSTPVDSHAVWPPVSGVRRWRHVCEARALGASLAASLPLTAASRSAASGPPSRLSTDAAVISVAVSVCVWGQSEALFAGLWGLGRLGHRAAAFISRVRTRQAPPRRRLLPVPGPSVLPATHGLLRQRRAGACAGAPDGVGPAFP